MIKALKLKGLGLTLFPRLFLWHEFSEEVLGSRTTIVLAFPRTIIATVKLGHVRSSPRRGSEITEARSLACCWLFGVLPEFDGKHFTMGSLELPPTADFHVHLRDGTMMELVTPTIRQGGVDTVFVMVRYS